MSEIVWTEAALANLRAIRAYIEQFNPHAAGRVATELIQAGESLAISPYRGRLVTATNLRELVTTWPYVIRYRIAEDRVLILRIRHTSRRPTRP